MSSPRLPVLLALAAGVAAAMPRPSPVAIVVGVQSAIDAVTVDTLRELYLCRRRLWPSGERVVPVNLPADDDVRARFSQRVLGRRPTELQGHWRRLAFEGIRPPLVLQTPEAVCAYVAAEPSAIGYVPLDRVDRASCRILLVLPEPPD